MKKGRGKENLMSVPFHSERNAIKLPMARHCQPWKNCPLPLNTQGCQNSTKLLTWGGFNQVSLWSSWHLQAHQLVINKLQLGPQEVRTTNQHWNTAGRSSTIFGTSIGATWQIVTCLSAVFHPLPFFYFQANSFSLSPFQLKIWPTCAWTNYKVSYLVSQLP